MPATKRASQLLNGTLQPGAVSSAARRAVISWGYYWRVEGPLRYTTRAAGGYVAGAQAIGEFYPGPQQAAPYVAGAAAAGEFRPGAQAACGYVSAAGAAGGAAS